MTQALRIPSQGELAGSLHWVELILRPLRWVIERIHLYMFRSIDKFGCLP